MIEETALISRLDGEFALVAPESSGGCGNCSSNATCGAGAMAQAIGGGRRTLLRARNPIGACPGQRVVIGIAEAQLNKAAILTYLLPLVGLILGAVLGEAAAGLLIEGSREPGAILGGLLGLAAVFVWLRGYSSRNADNTALQPVILRHASGGEPVRFEPRSPSSSHIVSSGVDS